MFLFKYSLGRNNTIASLFRTEYTPDFLIAEYYGLRNTIFWVTEDPASRAGLSLKNDEVQTHNAVSKSVATFLVPSYMQ
jgi:hypothetical protein